MPSGGQAYTYGRMDGQADRQVEGKSHYWRITRTRL